MSMTAENAESRLKSMRSQGTGRHGIGNSTCPTVDPQLGISNNRHFGDRYGGNRVANRVTCGGGFGFGRWG